MDRSLKLATPATAARIRVPESVPAPGVVPMATATLAVEVVWFPKASRMLTWTAGEMALPAVALLGCTLNASWDAAPGVMLKADEVAPVRPVELATSVYPFPDRLMDRLRNVATPPEAAT